ncbi:glutathione-regulated potassium-efflux system protein KefC [Escherichia coli]|uniref:Glutathione-regulated potassium-efflux system protein KefC n=1 Tax=Escherichia coli TaxID=562 RepID=A0A376ZKV2_ECOLX|nr:glutathione-regulated potassium-efflux system protein KefC [Escherichia coli]
MVENDTKARAAVYKRTSAMLSEIITEDREHLSLIQRHGWQGTEEVNIPATWRMNRKRNPHPNKE